ncbi:helix-turn-helix transcriptional regulator [Roseibium limicola]|uniref:Helix-turn-helix transcriptional regulator n=1 Tax=Roseibium limicola TaxID=2816037 RepID=A0A939ELU1_9HYPH|nr:AraC family transcriptional regulator [Roseibium limicola]MBO0344939.1 helix-turn-helix transcriptional regulator [Roseibium limicola]
MGSHDSAIASSGHSQRFDRLSALISHLRVHATLVEARDVEADTPNFLIFSNADGGIRLVYTPNGAPTTAPEPLSRDRLNRSAKLRGSEKIAASALPGEITLVAACVELAGVGPHLVMALPETLSIRLDEAPDLACVVLPLAEEVMTPRCGGMAVFLRLCEVVVIRLLRHAIERGSANAGLMAGLAHPRLAHALVAMHNGPSKPWSLENLADEAGMSRTQFAVTFREVLGVTPGGYLSDWRLALARIALQRGEPVKTVARNCGFSSSASFSRAFSRRFGESPSRLRVTAGEPRDGMGQSYWAE